MAEECFLSEDNKKSRIDVVRRGEEPTARTEETRQARSLGDRLQDGMTTSREQDLEVPLGRKCLFSGLLKLPNYSMKDPNLTSLILTALWRYMPY